MGTQMASITPLASQPTQSYIPPMLGCTSHLLVAVAKCLTKQLQQGAVSGSWFEETQSTMAEQAQAQGHETADQVAPTIRKHRNGSRCIKSFRLYIHPRISAKGVVPLMFRVQSSFLS